MCLSVYWYRKFNLDIALNTIRQECPSKRARACRVKLRDYQFVWSAPSGSNWMIIRFVLSKVNNGRNKRIYALGLRPFEPLDDFAPTLSYQIDKFAANQLDLLVPFFGPGTFFLHNSVTYGPGSSIGKNVQLCSQISCVAKMADGKSVSDMMFCPRRPRPRSPPICLCFANSLIVLITTDLR